RTHRTLSDSRGEQNRHLIADQAHDQKRGEHFDKRREQFRDAKWEHKFENSQEQNARPGHDRRHSEVLSQQDLSTRRRRQDKHAKGAAIEAKLILEDLRETDDYGHHNRQTKDRSKLSGNRGSATAAGQTSRQHHDTDDRWGQQHHLDFG